MKLAAFDVETAGTLQEYSLQPFRVRNSDAWLTSYVVTVMQDGAPCSIVKSLSCEPLRQAAGIAGIRSFLVQCAERGITVVGWNTPFDAAWLIALGLRDEVFACDWLDAMLLYRHLSVEPMLKGQRPKSYGLKEAVATFYPAEAGYEEGIDFQATDAESVRRRLAYNAKDGEFTLRLARKFLDQMTPEQRRAAFVEAACIPMVAETMVEGLAIDRDAAETLRTQLDEKQATTYALMRFEHGADISREVLASPKQLGDLLFGKWRLPVVKLTALGNVSTDKDALDTLAQQDPRARQVHEYREAVYNKTKFADATLAALDYNADGHVRPAHRIYGTYCVPGDVEVLTRGGWVRLDEWGGGEIVQVRPDLSMEFLPAGRFVGPVTNEWVRINHGRLQCDFTAGHTMPYLARRTGHWSTCCAGDLLQRGRRDLPLAGSITSPGGGFTPEQMRIFAMVQADGWMRSGARTLLKLTFKKQRKVDRAEALLRSAGVTFRKRVWPSYPDRTEIVVCKRDLPPWLTPQCKHLGAWLLDTSAEGLEAFVDEVVHWDGSPHRDGGVKYSSVEKANVEWVVTLAHLTGKRATVHAPQGDMYTCHISDERPVATVYGSRHVTRVSNEARAYCATTVTGFWLARSNGRIFITGNTGRMTISSKQGKGKQERPTGIALHQWKRGADYRNQIAAPEGYQLVEWDFAGQEFRWMAVMSRDPTMLELCAPGEDAHAFMGGKVTGTPYRTMCELKDTDPVIEGYRKLGKVGNLSLQYRTSANTLMTVARVQYQVALTMSEANALHSTYQLTYRQVPVYWRRQIYKGRRDGFVETLAGRRVFIGTGDLWTPDTKWQRESTSINFPIQGIGADQKYLALQVMRDWLPKYDGRFYYELHDGLFFIFPDRHARKAVEEGQRILSSLPYEKAWGVKLPVEFPVDAKIGRAWGSLKKPD